MKWLDVRQQAITWTIVEPVLCCHMAPLGPSEIRPYLTYLILTEFNQNKEICVIAWNQILFLTTKQNRMKFSTLDKIYEPNKNSCMSCIKIILSHNQRTIPMHVLNKNVPLHWPAINSYACLTKKYCWTMTSCWMHFGQIIRYRHYYSFINSLCYTNMLWGKMATRYRVQYGHRASVRRYLVLVE